MASDATIWQGPSEQIPAVNSDGNIYEETHVATPGQTVFNLLTFSYAPGTKTIFVFKAGDILRRATQFSETDSDTVTLATPCVGGENVSFVAFAIAQVDPPATLNGVPQGGSANQILQKIDGTDYSTRWVDSSALSASLLDAPRQNIASAPTVDLTGVVRSQSRNIQLTGTTQIDGFQITNGEVWAVKFAAALVLKNNANIVTNTGADIAVVPNATCFIRAVATNTVEVLAYSAAAAPISVSSINGGQLAGLRNKIINGNFQVNQRGWGTPVVLGAGSRGHDRWKAGAAGCTYTWAAVGRDVVITITAGSLMQVIDGENIEAGTYLISHAGSAQCRVGVNGAAPAGAYSAAPLITPVASAGQHLTVEFGTGTVSKVQVEAGSSLNQVTPFEYRLVALEHELCRWYFELHQHNAANLFAINAAAGGQTFSSLLFKDPKRVTPTIVIGSVTPINCTVGSFANNSRVFGVSLTSVAAGLMYITAISISAEAEILVP